MYSNLSNPRGITTASRQELGEGLDAAWVQILPHHCVSCVTEANDLTPLGLSSFVEIIIGASELWDVLTAMMMSREADALYTFLTTALESEQPQVKCWQTLYPLRTSSQRCLAYGM